MKRISFSVVFIASILCAVHADILRKNLAGPPEEFESFKIPDPVTSAASSISSLIPVRYEPSLNSPSNYYWQSGIVVDSSTFFAFSLYSPVNAKVNLVDPEGVVVSLLEHQLVEDLHIWGETVPAITYSFIQPKLGLYRLEILVPSEEVPLARSLRAEDDSADAYVVVMNLSPLMLLTHLNTYHLIVGQEIGLSASIVDNSEEDLHPELATMKANVMTDVIFSARVEVAYPDGRKELIPMHDNGIKGDQFAGDGSYFANIPATEPGYYTASSVISGIDMKGNEFVRTAQHLIAVSSVLSDYSGSASLLDVTGDNMAVISLSLTEPTDNTLRVYAELWGKKGDEDVAICWFGGLADAQGTEEASYVSFQVDLTWFARSNTQGPYQLRNLILQDVESWAIVDEQEVISLTIASSDVLAKIQSFLAAPRALSVDITERMREGVRPAAFAVNQSSLQDAPASLVLLHGYCSPTNPWAQSPNDFTNGQYFLNPSASLSHDEYSKKVIDWSAKYGAFSAIGHSQGGNVIAHLKNYYWSGLDQLTGTGRLLQSVATPYQGNTAAGSLANIGKVFGIGCGTNVDLTVDGSKLWLAGLTAATKAQIYYYSATYKQSAFIDYCNLAANLIIATYNDGTAELKYTPLPGANFLGNAEPWCHSDGMKYTATFLDHARNAQMNSAARRS